MSAKQNSTKGWNWGHYELTEKEIEFQVDKKYCFGIPYADIAVSSANGKNEVAFEFTGEADQTKGDILCEMRFHVPNNELEVYLAEKEKNQEENKGEDEDSDKEEMTAAKLFDMKINQKTNLSQTTGAVVASLPDLPMLIPRGNYSLDFYSNFCKLHGKTHDYKIMFKDINRIFMLQKPDGQNIVYLLQLDQPLRQGLTIHNFIAMNFNVERQAKVKINLKEDEIKAKYGDGLQQENEGNLYEVLSALFNNLVGVKKIIVPGDHFKSSKGAKAFSCSVKAADGYLFPLKASLVFIHKPVMYIRHTELRHVEFGRAGAGVRTFDLTLTTVKGDQNVTFSSIEKEEQKGLVEYFKAAGIKMKTVDLEGQKSDMKDVPSENEGRADANMIDDDDEEDSEDESFNEVGSQSLLGEGSDGDEEAEDQEDDSDVEMDEIDKAELKELQKEVGDVNLTERRPRRTGRK